MISRGPVRTDIVLVGGGHAHVQVMTRLAMNAPPGIRLTLVTRDLDTPYSGMLPGHVAGLYGRDEIHIDLARLAFATGTRLIHAAATGIDRQAKRVLLEGRPPIAYDLLSLNIGITPDLASIEGAEAHGLVVKPISRFIEKFEALRAAAAQKDGPRRIAVVGGGVAGVELALALHHRLRSDARATGTDPEAFTVTLVAAGGIVPTLNGGIRRRVEAALAARRIEVISGERVVRIEAESLSTEGGKRIAADAAFVSTRARAPAWLAQTGLPLAADGAVKVRPGLQSLADDDIFAVGDCALMESAPREKAGVFAVRQGPVVAANLLARARGEVPRPYRPQKRFLVLIGTGDGAAIGGRGGLVAFSGRWAWAWKDHIDRRFMAMFSAYNRQGPVLPDADGEIPPELRCGGCAAKLGPGPLARALKRLPDLPATEDAAIIGTPDGRLELESIDQITAFLDDPYRFGEIAALHALSDIHAMGGRPTRALANAVLAPAPPEKQAEELFQLLSGVRAALDREGVALLGGHSSEGGRLALGLAVTGEVAADRLTRKGGARPGDRLILTKPIGTGIVFAAAMRGAAAAATIGPTIAAQRRSNATAAQILATHAATAVTDVTGFGLAGHLAEMLTASAAGAVLWIEAIPLLPGVADLAAAGFASSLLAQNRVAEGVLFGAALDPPWPALLFDPQTSGGLLAAVPEDAAEAALAALRAAGDGEAAVIGIVAAGTGIRIAARPA